MLNNTLVPVHCGSLRKSNCHVGYSARLENIRLTVKGASGSITPTLTPFAYDFSVQRMYVRAPRFSHSYPSPFGNLHNGVSLCVRVLDDAARFQFSTGERMADSSRQRNRLSVYWFLIKSFFTVSTAPRRESEQSRAGSFQLSRIPSSYILPFLDLVSRF